MRRRRLQSAQKALVIDVMNDTLPLNPGTRKFFATSPLGSCRQHIDKEHCISAVNQLSHCHFMSFCYGPKKLCSSYYDYRNWAEG